MKTIKLLGIIMLFFAVDSSAQQINAVEVQVIGLTCSMCSNGTQKSLETISFIQSVKPDLNKSTFVLNFKKGANINLDLIRKKVLDAGFSVGELAVNFTFNQFKTDENGQATIDGNIYRFVNSKNKTLNGAIKANVIDKGFISKADFKKQSAVVNSDAYVNGLGTIKGKQTRIYHLSI